MSKWDEGIVCDVCHQVHRQMSPACIERRKARDYAESEEGQRALEAMIDRAVAAMKHAPGPTRWYDEDGVPR